MCIVCKFPVNEVKPHFGIECCKGCECFLGRLAKDIQVKGKTFDFCKFEKNGKECHGRQYCVYHKYRNALAAGFKLEGMLIFY